MSWYASLAGILAFIVAGPFIHGIGQADDAPITRNVPIPDFQNPNDTKSYDFDATPQGLFLSIHLRKGLKMKSDTADPTKSFPSIQQNRFAPIRPSI
jgi:hypothetical protein